MRGYSVPEGSDGQGVGYNPAYAGILFHTWRVFFLLQIQPRVCGDTTALVFRAVFVLDTTPRMRGYLKELKYALTERRYNPAYAGILPADPQ